MVRLLAAFVAMAWLGGLAPALAEDPPAEDPSVKKEEKKEEADETTADEKVVVSASAVRSARIDAPAAVDVIDGETLTAAPGDVLVDHLRRVPGVNVVQFSARDVNIASRSATGGINNSTVALSDGRTLYQDFLGFVLWEFAPTDFSLVDRVEVVRGPASALWGANAVGGVVHVITKSPRDTLGGRASVEAGNYATRRIEAQQSFLAGPWALRVSGSFYDADAFERPATIVNFYGETIDPDLGLIDESFVDSRTRQPRLDVRADRDTASGGQRSLQGGWGRTAGWIATGLGPFQIDTSTGNSYLQARYRKGLYEAQVDVTGLDGDAINLINALPFDFASLSLNASFRGRTILGNRGVFGWGAEAGRSNYELSIAPDADHRTKGALFGEVDYRLGDRWWGLIGARVDHFRETIGTVVSPRVALRFKPTPQQTVRVAWGQAFRAPSVIENQLDVPAIPVALLNWQELDEETVGFPFFEPLSIAVCSTQPDNCGAPEGEAPDYVAVTAAQGNLDLEEEETRSIEAGYAARLGRFDVSTTVYYSRSTGGIDFPIQATYGAGPDGIPGTEDDIVLPSDPDGDGIEEAPPVDVCPFLAAIPPFDEVCASGPVPYNHALSILLDGQIPSLFAYENRGLVENRGVELGSTWFGPRGLSVTVNYSWQDDPVSNGLSMTDRIDLVLAETESGEDLDGDGAVADTSDFVNIPAEHRLSVSAQLQRRRWFAGASWDWVDRTFWQDVLTSDFWGWVPGYSLVGLRGGWDWPDSRIGVRAQVTNLLGETIQQHIYGDLIGRRATVGLTFGWGGPDDGPP